MARTPVLLAALCVVVHSSRLEFEASTNGSQADPDPQEKVEQEKVEEVSQTLPKIRVKAYWIRHGASCANVLQMQAQQTKFGGGKMHGLTFGLYRDPPLTDCAIARAKGLGPLIWDKIMQDNSDIDIPGGKPLVFSSEMTRAQETAIHNFPDQSVFPIPHIAEHGQGWDNKPQASVMGQANDIKKPANVQNGPTGAELASNVVYMDAVNPESGRIVGGKGKSSYVSFKKEFPDILAKMTVGGRLKDGDTIPVIIVGHSGYMRDELTCELRTAEEIKAGEDRIKPKNNEVWLQEYTTFLPDGSKLLEGQTQRWTVSMKAGACSLLFPRETYPDWPTLMCQKDINRCAKERLPDVLIQRDKDECNGLAICAGEL